MMLRRYSHFFAYILLLLMPLQVLAAANMRVCNSVMQLSNQSTVSVMPCHNMKMAMADMTKASDNDAHKNTGKSTCKTACASLCASLCSLTALNQTAAAMPVLVASQAIVAHNNTYTSYSPPKLQRPPNFLS
jgi:hypothetical protein